MLATGLLATLRRRKTKGAANLIVRGPWSNLLSDSVK